MRQNGLRNFLRFVARDVTLERRKLALGEAPLYDPKFCELLEEFRTTAEHFLTVYKGHLDLLDAVLLQNPQLIDEDTRRVKDFPKYTVFESAVTKAAELSWIPEAQRSRNNDWYTLHRDAYIAWIEMNELHSYMKSGKNLDVRYSFYIEGNAKPPEKPEIWSTIENMCRISANISMQIMSQLRQPHISPRP